MAAARKLTAPNVCESHLVWDVRLCCYVAKQNKNRDTQTEIKYVLILLFL